MLLEDFQEEEDIVENRSMHCHLTYDNMSSSALLKAEKVLFSLVIIRTIWHRPLRPAKTVVLRFCLSFMTCQ